MGQINTGRVVIAGIAAGLIIDVGEAFSNLWLFAARLAPVMEALNLPEVGGSAVAMYNLLGLGVGITMAWLYAAVRPRLGPGPSTGLCAGLVCWALFSLFGNLNWMIGGAIPWDLGIMIIVYQAVEFSVAGYIAGMLYQEG